MIINDYQYHNLYNLRQLSYRMVGTNRCGGQNRIFLFMGINM